MSREHEYEISPHLGRREGSRGVDSGGRSAVRPGGPPKVFQVVRQVPRDTTVYLDTTGSCYTQSHLNFFLGLSLPALCIFRLPIHLFCLSRSKGRGELMTEKDPARRPGRYANLVGNVMSSLGCARERAIGKRNRTIFFFSLSADVCMYWYHHYCTFGRGGLIRRGRSICRNLRTLASSRNADMARCVVCRRRPAIERVYDTSVLQ